LVTRILGKEAYKDSNSYTTNDKLSACMNVVEDIIHTFSDKDVKTCVNCRKLIADIISNQLLGENATGEGGHESDARERGVTKFDRHYFQI
jgi:hypothetical protein